LRRSFFAATKPHNRKTLSAKEEKNGSEKEKIKKFEEFLFFM